MVRELKDGDRLIDWDDASGVAKDVEGEVFTMCYDDSTELQYNWVEFSEVNASYALGTFRFADTEYPLWPL